MSQIVLRLAGSLQSWAGYRHQVNMTSSVPTAAMPRKSGVSGLLGAALGPQDNGFGSARDLHDLAERFSMHVRIETRNPVAEDFQVLGPLGPQQARRADVMGRLGTASTKEFRNERRSDGNFATTVSRRDFLSHSEFLVALEGPDDHLDAWWQALRRPVFMPYLGRRSCAPSFPFTLGIHRGPLEELFGSLPHVSRLRSRHDVLPALAGFTVTGGYDLHHENPHSRPYHPPSGSRSEQLIWVKENLSS